MLINMNSHITDWYMYMVETQENVLEKNNNLRLAAQRTNL